MCVCAQKKIEVTPLYPARTRHAVRVHALHVAGIAHEVQTARHTRAPVHVTHKSLCSTPSALSRPTSVVQRFWRFIGVYPPSLVCLLWTVCIAGGLVVSFVTGRCCVLHVVFLWDDYCLVRCSFECTAPRLIYVEAMPEVPPPEARIGLFTAGVG